MSFDLALIDGSINIKPDGSVRTISDTPKLRQDILKIILTPLGSNRFHPWYGSSVSENIIGRGFPDNLIESEIQSTIEQSLERLKQLQLSQVTTQEVSLAELISSIGPITANRNPLDPRQINIRVSVTTKRLTKIEEVFQLIS